MNKINSIITTPNGFEKAARLVPLFYFFLLLVSFQKLEGLGSALSLEQNDFAPRWPLFWSYFVDYQTAVTAIVLFFVASSIIGAYFYRHAFGRILAFAGMLEYHALLSSYGRPFHQWDLWLWVAFIFMFLPNAWNDERPSAPRQQSFLLVFWGAQAFVLLTYSMSGLLKLASSADEYLRGAATSFSIDAAALHASSLLYAMQETTPLGPLIVNYPVLGWLPFLFFVYLEVFSFFVAFTPSLHRPWALLLVLFHAGTYLAMRAIFVGPVALLALLFFDSPFRKPGASWREIALDVPLLGWVARLVGTMKVPRL